MMMMMMTMMTMKLTRMGCKPKVKVEYQPQYSLNLRRLPSSPLNLSKVSNVKNVILALLQRKPLSPT